MNQLLSGNFFGETNQTTNLEGIILTDTEYTHDYVDWHYHENAYFTFILQGKITEHNKNETYNCSAGSLLFHNCQEPHFNIKPKGYTRGFHVELKKKWLTDFDVNAAKLERSINILDPKIKLLFYKIFKETKSPDDISLVSIEQLLLQVFTELSYSIKSSSPQKPLWVNKVREILHDNLSEKISLESLSGSVNIHPVHLSRDFHKYFQCNLGSYIRKLKVERSLSLLPDKQLSLTDIAFSCGFADQSHFLRCFKEINGINPSAYRKILCKN